MLPSSALFADLECPLFRGGHCDRPFCHYKHKKTNVVSDFLATSAAGPGEHNFTPVRGALHNSQESEACRLELERINKEIETVRAEVEKEQKRLSRYQSAQADTFGSCSEQPPNKPRNARSKDRGGSSRRHTLSAHKYVVDRSKPKTDLEYDPCSNFSADLLSNSSAEHKLKAFDERDIVFEDIKGASDNNCLSQIAPQDPDETDDEGILVIDIPSLENESTRNRLPKQNTKTSNDLEITDGDVNISVLASEDKQKGHKSAIQKSKPSVVQEESPKRAPTPDRLSLLKDNIRVEAIKQSMISTMEPSEVDLEVGFRPLENDQKHSGQRKPRKAMLPCDDRTPVLDSSLADCDQNGKRPFTPTIRECSIEETLSKDGLLVENDQTSSEDRQQSMAITKESLEPSEEDLAFEATHNNDKNMDELPDQSMCATRDSCAISEGSMPCSMDSAEVCIPTSLCLSEKGAIASQCAENAQNIRNVLDDLSMCLDKLKGQSENINCLQAMENKSDMVLDCSTMDRGISLLSNEKHVENTGIGRAESVILLNKNSSSHLQKAQILPLQQTLRKPVGSLAFQQCPPSSGKAEEQSLACQVSQHLIETSWPPVQAIEVQACMQDMVANMPENFTGVHVSPSVKQPNLMATTEDLPQCKILPKLSEPDATSATCESSNPSAANVASAKVTTDIQDVQMGSSSEKELNYSDLDLSETDPMEECYNIFMEANKGDSPTAQADIPVEATEIPEMVSKTNLGPGLKRRVAHVAKFEVDKNKAQVFIPLRGEGSQQVNPARVQQCQRRAAVLTAAVKGGQSFVTANGPKKVYAPAIVHPSHVQNSCVSVIPMGATLRLGPNLHFIVSEGTCALPVTLVSPATVVPQPAQPTQDIRPAQPTQPTSFTPIKSVATKRKAKSRPEIGVKVSHDVRQRYVNQFVEEFLKTSVTVQEAFEKALAEEKIVYDRSINKLKYLSVAVNALKRLKNQSATSVKASAERNAGSRGNIALNTRALQGDGDAALYEQLKEHILTEQMLRENNYALKHPERPGFAIQYEEAKRGITDTLKRICCRCGATFSVNPGGKHLRKEECTYHYGKVIENKVPGGMETRYSCCESAVGTPGCQVFKLHVHDTVSLQGFVSTPTSPSPGTGCPGVYALDCEMCYTTQGVELVRVSVVNSSLQVIYDTFVKPDYDVIDYNTRFSGVSEEDVNGTSSSLHDVQALLLSFINEDTILIGHGLENDLCALKLFHSTVIDTSAVFPHRLGLPHKLDLHSLTAEYLRRIIQESAEGHDSSEDAAACMELMMWKVKEDAKVRRW